VPPETEERENDEDKDKVLHNTDESQEVAKRTHYDVESGEEGGEKHGVTFISCTWSAPIWLEQCHLGGPSNKPEGPRKGGKKGNAHRHPLLQPLRPRYPCESHGNPDDPLWQSSVPHPGSQLASFLRDTLPRAIIPREDRRNVSLPCCSASEPTDGKDVAIQRPERREGYPDRVCEGTQRAIEGGAKGLRYATRARERG
jgi:hypothetical protein